MIKLQNVELYNHKILKIVYTTFLTPCVWMGQSTRPGPFKESYFFIILLFRFLLILSYISFALHLY